MFYTKTTQLPYFVPVPHFLLRLPLSPSAKLLYALLLNRTQLSQQNGWASLTGRVYVIYPIQELAQDLGISARTVQTLLSELEKADLLWRDRRGRNRSNHLYLKLPDQMPPPKKTPKNPPPLADPDPLKTALQEVQYWSYPEVQKFPPSNKYQNNNT